MKKMMKNGMLFLLCVLLLLPVLGLSAFAQTEQNPYVQWELSADSETISGNGRVYAKYDHDWANVLVINPAKRYYFANSLPFRPRYSDEPYLEGEVRSCQYDAEWIWVKTEKGSYLYATEKGAEPIDALLEGDIATYLIMDADWQRASIGVKLWNNLQARVGVTGVKTKKLSGTALQGYEHYYVGGTDRTNSFVVRSGMVFNLADEYYYLDMAKEGYPYDVFTLEDTVTLYQLDTATANSFVEGLDGLAPLQMEHSYEQDEYFYYEDEFIEDDHTGNEHLAKNSVAVFMVMFVIVGIFPPIALLVLGLVLARSEKRKKPHHWYVLTISSVLWLLTAVACFVVAIVI